MKDQIAQLLREEISRLQQALELVTAGSVEPIVSTPQPTVATPTAKRTRNVTPLGRAKQQLAQAKRWKQTDKVKELESVIAKLEKEQKNNEKK